MEDAPWKEIESFGADVCVHAAWITTPGVYLESPDNYRFRDASLKFLQQLAGCGVRYVLALGTCIEYEITPAPLSEDKTPLAPTTTYARCKNELRMRLEAEAGDRGFGLCWGRVFYPYGPGEHPSRLCSSIIERLSRGEQVLLKTPHSTKDYIYIEDLASALLTVIEKHFCGAINLGTGTGVTVKSIAETLGGLMGKQGLIHEQAPPGIDPLPSVVADASRLFSLGWRPAYDAQRGLEQLLKSRSRSTDSF